MTEFDVQSWTKYLDQWQGLDLCKIAHHRKSSTSTFKWFFTNTDKTFILGRRLVTNNFMQFWDFAEIL